MIFDQIKHLSRYRSLSSRFAVAADFLGRPDLADLPDGRTDLIPGEVWAIVMTKPARQAAEAQFEFHRHFADIQCCVAGQEQLGWHPSMEGLSVAKPYDTEKDAGMLHGPIREFLPLQPGWFSVLFPEEPHAPLIGSGTLKKVVLKVLVA